MEPRANVGQVGVAQVSQRHIAKLCPFRGQQDRASHRHVSGLSFLLDPLLLRVVVRGEPADETVERSVILSCAYTAGEVVQADVVQLGQLNVTPLCRGKGGTARTVKIGHQAARSLDRYLRARAARHAQAHRPQLWLGVDSRGPLTAGGIYQVVARRGRQCGVTVYPHRFRHHFSHTVWTAAAPSGT